MRSPLFPRLTQRQGVLLAVVAVGLIAAYYVLSSRFTAPRAPDVADVIDFDDGAFSPLDYVRIYGER